jgi:hypothetical protein
VDLILVDRFCPPSSHPVWDSSCTGVFWSFRRGVRGDPFRSRTGWRRIDSVVRHQLLGGATDGDWKVQGAIRVSPTCPSFAWPPLVGLSEVGLGDVVSPTVHAASSRAPRDGAARLQQPLSLAEWKKPLLVPCVFHPSKWGVRQLTSSEWRVALDLPSPATKQLPLCLASLGAKPFLPVKIRHYVVEAFSQWWRGGWGKRGGGVSLVG